MMLAKLSWRLALPHAIAQGAPRDMVAAGGLWKMREKVEQISFRLEGKGKEAGHGRRDGTSAILVSRF